jgi:hypothetical protein
MSDLRQRVPGHSLIERLLREWDRGTIHLGQTPEEVVIDDEARGWYLGVHGERWVAARLALLGPEFTVLHSVPIGNGESDIDHVVIGPPGVFTINTKYSPDKKIWSNGYGVYVGNRPENHFVRNLDFEVRRASQRLSKAVGFPVRPMGLLVFVDPAIMDRKGPIGNDQFDLRVISDAEMLDTIGNREALDPEQVRRISECAVLSTTWRDLPISDSIGSHIAQEFSALEEAVGPLTLPSTIARENVPRVPIRRVFRAPRVRTLPARARLPPSQAAPASTKEVGSARVARQACPSRRPPDPRDKARLL